MAERMSERAKDDIDRILRQLHKVAPEIDRIAQDCNAALKTNMVYGGDYISPQTVTAFSDMRDAIAALYISGQAVMTERDRFFKPESR